MNRVSLWCVLAGFALVSLGCGGGDQPAAPANSSGGGDVAQEIGSAPPAGETVQTPMPAVNPTAGMSKDVPQFIAHAKDNTALVVIRPSKALSNPLVKELLAKVKEADPSFRFEEDLARMADDIGVHPKDIEYAVVSASQGSLQGMLPFGPGGPGPGFDGPPDAAAPFESPTDDLGVNKIPSTPAEEAGAAEAQDGEKEAPCAESAVESNTGEAAVAVDAAAESVQVDAPSDANTPFADDAHGNFEADMPAWEPPPSPVVLVRLKTAVDQEKFIAAKEASLKAKWGGIGEAPEDELDPNDPFFAEMKKYREEAKARMEAGSKVNRAEYKGYTVLQAGESLSRACFLNDQTLVFGSEADIQATIDRNGKVEDSPLVQQISALADRDLAVVVDLTPFKEILAVVNEQAPFPVKMILGPVMQSKGLALSADLEGKSLLELQIIAAGEQEAQNLHSILNPMLTQQLEQAKQMKAQAIEAGQVPPEGLPLLPLADNLLNGITFTAAKDVVSLTITRPAGIEELPTLLEPVLAKVAEAAKKSKEQNDLHNIAIAFHNFEGAFGTFPANNRDGDVDGPTGLSWRVHLLPFVEEKPLYDEFHLDEPWDSDHNKTLIARMPAIYGDNAEGKSRIHMFVGEGMLFSRMGKIGFAQVTDGTSNTILVVKAGEDTADIWTKPGGLTIDKENPVAALGNIAEDFLVALMDGSVRKLSKSIDAETLRNLIDHQDGNPVEIPE